MTDQMNRKIKRPRHSHSPLPLLVVDLWHVEDGPSLPGSLFFSFLSLFPCESFHMGWFRGPKRQHEREKSSVLFLSIRRLPLRNDTTIPSLTCVPQGLLRGQCFVLQ